LHVNSRVQIFAFKNGRKQKSKHSRKEIIGYHINLREKQKVTTLPGYNVTKN